jgi:5'-3' exonuclease
MKPKKQQNKFDKNVVLLVDGNFLAYKSYFPVENKKIATKRFLNSTYRLKEKSGASHVTVSFDHDIRENFRYEYK